MSMNFQIKIYLIIIFYEARRRLTTSGATSESSKRHRIGHVSSHSFMYRNTKKKSWLTRRFDDLENNASVPINKFIYWEFSKVLYYVLLIITLIPSEEDGKLKRVSKFKRSPLFQLKLFN